MNKFLHNRKYNFSHNENYFSLHDEKTFLHGENFLTQIMKFFSTQWKLFFLHDIFCSLHDENYYPTTWKVYFLHNEKKVYTIKFFLYIENYCVLDEKFFYTSYE